MILTVHISKCLFSYLSVIFILNKFNCLLLVCRELSMLLSVSPFFPFIPLPFVKIMQVDNVLREYSVKVCGVQALRVLSVWTEWIN